MTESTGSKKRSRIWIWISLAVLFVVFIVLPCMFALWFLHSFRPPTHTDIRNRVERSSDIDKLQEWAVDFLKDPRTQIPHNGTGWWQGDDMSMLPDFVQALEPGYVSVHRHGTPDDYIEITWGGGLGHFGVSIGRPTLHLKSKSSEDYSWEYRRWRDGVHTWIE